MGGANLHKDMLKRSRSCEPNGSFQVGFNVMRASKRYGVPAPAESGIHFLNLGGTAEQTCFVLRVSFAYS